MKSFEFKLYAIFSDLALNGAHAITNIFLDVIKLYLFLEKE